jgi:thiol-disulfide isomerase/thioredoxin
MRRSCLFTFLFLLAAVPLLAAPLPMTVKEVSLMLRAGDSNARVVKELATRHFVDTIDSMNEVMLTKAGASPDLIAALKNGTYSLSPEESAAARQQIVDLTKQRAMDAERVRKSESAYQAQVARERTARSALPMTHPIAEATRGDLVRLESGRVTAVEEDPLANKKLIALYFAAQSSGPCRKFTPQLVDYYNRVAPQHPEIEFVFVSADKTADAMQNHMRDEKMPWPAIEFQKTAAKESIIKYAGKALPCLVLVDPAGRVVSDTYDGEKYVGPAKVVADLDTIFAGVAAKKVAAKP